MELKKGYVVSSKYGNVKAYSDNNDNYWCTSDENWRLIGDLDLFFFMYSFDFKNQVKAYHVCTPTGIKVIENNWMDAELEKAQNKLKKDILDQESAFWMARCLRNARIPVYNPSYIPKESSSTPTVKTNDNSAPLISLEDAIAIWGNLPKDHKASSALRKLCLKYYTQDQLEPKPKKKGFMWTECWPLHGYFFNNKSGFVEQVCGIHLLKDTRNKSVYKTEKQALSALAYAQLTHIVAKYNEGKKCKPDGFGTWIRPVQGFGHTRRLITEPCTFEGVITKDLAFCTGEDAKTSLEVNKELWGQYWMI